MREQLELVYGPTVGQTTYEALQKLAERYAFLKERETVKAAAERVTERDVLLITYGDQVQAEGQPPLQVLHGWLKDHLSGTINTVHILPFYPYTSDDGFSVVDYRQVDPALGSWADVQALHTDFRLMFDGVINHISASSQWFQAFLKNEPPYNDYFLVTDPQADLSSVTRPRALPLLTRFQTTDGPKYLWTTFSEDQLDLNYQNPQVLLDIADLLLFYVSQGADLIRLDAIGYLWKEIGTSSIHLPQTHAVVQVLRALLDECTPNTLLITETNVPHQDNISYFGNGHNEAQLVYQFPLVPLVLNGLATGEARHLQKWAATLQTPSDTTTFFNFLASHDGIGVVPARSLLTEAEIQALVERTLSHDGQVSYKNNSDGTQSPYELNITFFDALSNSTDNTEPESLKIDRFLASQAIMLAMQGVPGIYFHSLLGSHSWQAGFAETGRNRTLNREKLQRPDLDAELANPQSHTAQVFGRYIALIRTRIAQPAFHPNAAQQVLTGLDEALFGLLRTTLGDEQNLLALHNLSNETRPCRLDLAQLNLPPTSTWHDLLTNQTYQAQNGQLSFELAPYQVGWLTLE